MSKPIARLTVPTADLVRTLLSLPSSYAVIGSLSSDDLDTVALVVTSPEIGERCPPLTVEVSMDAGSTWTVRVVPDAGRYRLAG